MSWLGLVVLVIALYLAFKVASALLKVVLFVVMLVAAYWFIAPRLGWPSVSDLVYVLGPDLGGHRIEDLADPKRAATAAGDYVVDKARDELEERVLQGTQQVGDGAAVQSGGNTVDADNATPSDAPARDLSR